MIRNCLSMVLAIARRHLNGKSPLTLRAGGIITVKGNSFSKHFKIRRRRYDFSSVRCRVPQSNYAKPLTVFHIDPSCKIGQRRCNVACEALQSNFAHQPRSSSERSRSGQPRPSNPRCYNVGLGDSVPRLVLLQFRPTLQVYCHVAGRRRLPSGHY